MEKVTEFERCRQFWRSLSTRVVVASGVRMSQIRQLVTRVHGEGTQLEETISYGGERLCGTGVFGNVYAAWLFYPTHMRIAIKKTWPTGTTDPEINYLSQLNHPAVIKLLYHFAQHSNTGELCHCMVFEYLPSDMWKLRQSKPGRRLDLLDAKLYGFQLFCAIDYVSSLGIAHRDVKPSNLLVDDRTGILKLTDFGNAKLLRPDVENTPYQVTRYYRAPELIFGATIYTTAIDTWSCGCVLSEWVTGQVLLQGRSRYHQTKLIVEVFGYPTSEQCEAMHVRRPRSARRRARGLDTIVQGAPGCDEQLLSVLKSILRYEVRLRPSGSAVVAMPFFDALRAPIRPVRSNGSPLPYIDYGVTENRTMASDDTPPRSSPHQISNPNLSTANADDGEDSDDDDD